MTGLWLINYDVMQLNIAVGEPQRESGYGCRAQLKLTQKNSKINNRLAQKFRFEFKSVKLVRTEGKYSVSTISNSK